MAEHEEPGQDVSGVVYETDASNDPQEPDEAMAAEAAAAGADSDSYVQDVSWTGGLVPPQNPLLMRFVALLNEKAAPRTDVPFRYCDLGCAEGVTVLMLASAFPFAEFVGIDINPEHVEKANNEAADLGLTNASFHQADFADLESGDFGKFEFITCYGAFSWVHRNLQDSVLQFAADHLAHNGLFLVQYTSSPGKVQMDPLWHLMQTVTEDVDGTSAERAEAGIARLMQLAQSGALFFQQNPLAAKRLKNLPQENASAVAHNALSEWQALYHSDVAGRGEKFGITYAGQFPIGSNIEKLRLPAQFLALAEEYTDPMVRETVIDFLSNNGTRTDIYAKSSLTPEEAAIELDATPLVRSMETNVVKPWRPPNGRVMRFNHPTHKSVIEKAWGAGVTVGGLVEQVANDDVDARSVRTTAAILVAAGILEPATHLAPLPVVSDDLSGLTPGSELLARAIRQPFDIEGTVFMPALTTGHPVAIRPMVFLFLDELLTNGQDDLEGRVVERLRTEGFPETPDGFLSLEHFVEEQGKKIRNGLLPRFISVGVVLKEATDPATDAELNDGSSIL